MWSSIRSPTKVSLLGIVIFISISLIASAQDVVELQTGAKVRGKITSTDGNSVSVQVKIGSKTYDRKYPKSRISAIVMNGKRTTMSNAGGGSSGSNDSSVRSTTEIRKMIDTLGKTPPDWYESTPLNYPKSLDLSWPMPAPKGWNNQKNVGQYIWDRINPNPDKWREGVKLMHHIMAQDPRNRRLLSQAMRSLGGMYHNLHEDYARSAFWLEQAGLDDNPSSYPHAGVQLANCYYQLGSKKMAVDLMKKMNRRPFSVIKLLGDMKETDGAVSTADAFAKNANEQGKTICYLYAGEACRLAGRFDDAERYLRKSVAAAQSVPKKNSGTNRNLRRAQANLAAIQFIQLDPTKVKDGTYKAASLGYEGDVGVEVKIAAGKITSVQVVNHKEKQFYSSIDDTTRTIVNQQTLHGIDTTTGATITSEAIIHATAKALSKGLQ